MKEWLIGLVQFVYEESGKRLSREDAECMIDEYDPYPILSIDDLCRLVRDFQADNFDGFVSNDKSYIENWLEENRQKSKR